MQEKVGKGVCRQILEIGRKYNAKGHLKVRYFNGLNTFINYKTEFLKWDVSVSL